MYEEQIHQQCIERYINNLNYFEKHYPEVFKKLGLFEVALDDGKYEEKYTLEYINGAFDIQYIKDGRFIYNVNLDKHSSTRADKIKLDDSNSFKLFNPIHVPPNYKIPEDITDTYLETLYPLVDFVKKNTNTGFRINKIEKFIFFGTLLGKHIETITKKLTPRVVMIIEPNIEIFKLSLFVTDYTSLDIKGDMFFAIANDEDELNVNINKFLKSYDYFNYLIKFDVIDSHYTYLFDNMANILANRSAVHFPFSARLMSIQRHTKLIEKRYNFIDFTKIIEAISSNPVILVAPGPSLATHIKWLHENQNNFIIVALGASLKTLYKHNIKPDIIVTIDPHPIILNQFEDIASGFYEHSILFASTNTPVELLDNFQKDKIFIYQAIYNLIDNRLFYGKTVGETAYRILLLLGVQNLYLLGTDLSVDKDTGSAHVKEHIHSKDIGRVEKHNLLQNNIISTDSHIEVDGNFENRVFTTRIFYDILEYYKKFTKETASDTREVYNLSNGAKIYGATPTATKQVAKIEMKNKTDTIKKLFNDLKQNSNEINLDKHIEDLVDSSLDVGYKILKILNSYKTKKFKSYDDMMYAKLTITIDIITASKDDINKIAIDLISSYNENVDQYVNVFFNNRQNQKNKNRFNPLFNYWLNTQITIFKKYIEILERFSKR